MVLMNRTLEICKPIKNKNYGYVLIFNYNNTERNLIQARSKSGRSRGIKGEVFANGSINWPQNLKLDKEKLKDINNKICFALDLAYSMSRNNKIQIQKDKIVVKTNIKNV